MRIKSVIFFVLVALLMLCAGYWLGRRSTAPASLASASSNKVSTKTAKKQPSPAKKNPLPSQSAISNRIEMSRNFLLAEIEAKILEMKNDDWRRDGEWHRILDDLAPTNIPPLLAFVDANLPESSRVGVRSGLLSCWVKTNPQAAMAYASALISLDERESAIGTVAGSWVETKPEAAGVGAKYAGWPRETKRHERHDFAVGAN